MKWMRSLFLAALCRYITIDSATWTVFFNPAATTNTTIARQHSSSRFSSPPVHKIARAHTRRQWKWLHVILFFSRLLFFTRAYTSICLFFILATLHDIAHHRRAAWQQRLKANFFTIFFFFLWTTCHSENHKFGACSLRSMLRCHAIIVFDSFRCNDSFSSLWARAHISSAKCIAVSVDFSSAFMFTFHFFVCQKNSVAIG